MNTLSVKTRGDMRVNNVSLDRMVRTKPRRKTKRLDWVLRIVLYAFVTMLFVVWAFNTRGYQAVGGEVLVVPMFYVGKLLWQSFKEVINFD